MLRYSGRVRYLDGREVTFEAGLPVQAAWEEYALRHGYDLDPAKVPRVLWALTIAHAALGVEEGFEVWRKTVDNFEIDTANVPPTLSAVTDGSA